MSDIYELPLFRYAHRAISSDGKRDAWIDQTAERSMGNPGLGLLHVSDGLQLKRCNPAFGWSDCSRYLAVPQWQPRMWVLSGIRLVVVDCQQRQLWYSKAYRHWLQVESFRDGVVVASTHFRSVPGEMRWDAAACFRSGESTPYHAA